MNHQKSRPTVSIIIPCRPLDLNNLITTNKKIISNLNNISNNNLEFIIVIDSHSIHIDELKETYKNITGLKFIAVGAHGHIGHLRNYGVIQSQAPYIYFIDADCELPISSLHYLANKISFYDITIGDTEFRGVNLISKYEARLRQFRYTSKQHAYCPNLLISRKLFNLIGGFNNNFRYGSDGDFSDRLINSGYKIYIDNTIKIVHYCDSSIHQTIRRWILYGYGRHMRYEINKIPWHDRNYFPESPSLIQSIDLKIFTLIHNIARCAGVIFYLLKKK